MPFSREYLRAELQKWFESTEVALDTDDEDLYDHCLANIDGLMSVLRPGADDIAE